MMEEETLNEEQSEESKGKIGEEYTQNPNKMAALTRKEKRKAMKKMKRKKIRKEAAVKEREEEELRINDPEEEMRLKAMEEEEAEKRQRELKEFEERERLWIEAMELKRKKEEEEREEEDKRRKDLEEYQKQQVDEENRFDEDEEFEYVEEGPPEIIFQGNEIIFRKKKVKVPKKDVKKLRENEDAERPTSNPLPPQSDAFADYHHNASSVQLPLENVAQQVPNFGTEQDKAHCPFHLKTGACRFGPRCSRVHFYPDKSCTLLLKNMYNGPGLAWEQDEGLEHTEEEVEHCYEEFYEDVHAEFLKFGEIVNFKVCRNGSFHLKGNVYVHYKSLESACLAHQSVNGRYFAGKQVTCEFVNVTRWKIAICGEFMKSRSRTCSRGTACNFIHCFRNPGGDYEWADWDRPPPRYWVTKMVALFGVSDEYERQMVERQQSDSKVSRTITTDSNRKNTRRSKSSNRDRRTSSSRPSGRNHGNDSDVYESSRRRRRPSSKDQFHNDRITDPSGSDDALSDGDVEQNLCKGRNSSSRRSGRNHGNDGDVYESSRGRRRPSSKDQSHDDRITDPSGSDDASSDEDAEKNLRKGREGGRARSLGHAAKELINVDIKQRIKETDSGGYCLDRDEKRGKHHSRSRKSSYRSGSSDDEDQLCNRKDRDTCRSHTSRSSSQQSKAASPADYITREKRNQNMDFSEELSDQDRHKNSRKRHISQQHGYLIESLDDRSKKRNHNTDYFKDRGTNDDRFYHHQRGNLGHHNKDSESPDENHITDSINERLETSMHRYNQRRKRSRHYNEVIDYSDDAGTSSRTSIGKSICKKVRESHSNNTDHDSMVTDEVYSHHRNVEVARHSRNADDGENCQGHEIIEELGRWKPHSTEIQ